MRPMPSPSDPFDDGAPPPFALVTVVDRATGLTAFIAIDDTTLGPAAGGVRTKRYESDRAALADVRALARAMTIKCALGGLDAGGGKCVVLEHDGLDRPRAFAALAERIEALGGLFRTAGDLGTTAADLAAMATRTRFVHTDETGLAAAVARGLVRCIEAAARAHRGDARLRGLSIAVQGAGAIGAAAARVLTAAGASVTLADVDSARAAAVAKGTGARVVDPSAILALDVDIVAPCATGGVIDSAAVRALHAWAIVGAANNVLASDAVAHELAKRGVLHVPDTIASAGAVIEGIGRTVMGLADRTPLIDALGTTASEVLAEARATGRPSSVVAAARAQARIARKRASGAG